ncbi:MAG: BON domain-containing protein [Rhizobiales bacterium]|nr:BON domain-containing protein [Hyphomicrobiales bacterium]OJX99495.1 MAG: hypothetical protein BGP07_05640 [Rhizobiales bacterium 63-22]
MKSWLWPGVTWTAALTALAVWFGAGRVEADIGDRAGAALSPFVWAAFDVDGRDVTLSGVAPDPAARDAARQALRQVAGIHAVNDLTSVLPLASPYVLKIMKSSDAVIFSGSIPDNALRDRLTEAAESAMPGVATDDEMALARGSGPQFQDSALFALQLAAKLKDGTVAISDHSLSVKGTAADAGARDAIGKVLAAPLPFGLKLAENDVALP